jgi:aryl-alcohol dehydrogenase-like predicted oxidoreductase
MQNHYNVAYREEEREMVPTLKARVHSPYPAIFADVSIFQHFGVGNMTYCSLARGLLTRPMDTASQREDKIPNLRKMYPSEMFPKLVNRYFFLAHYHGAMELRRS